MAHISGHGGSIEECSEVTKPIPKETEIFYKLKLVMKLKLGYKSVKRGREKESRDVEQADDKERAALVQSRTKSNSNSAGTCAVNCALFDFFYSLEIARNKVDHPPIKRFVQVTRNPPRAQRLNSSLLGAAEAQGPGISGQSRRTARVP